MKGFKLHILALIILMAGCGPTKQKTGSKESVRNNDSIAEQQFTSKEFEISFTYPQNWKTNVFEIGINQKIINIYPFSVGDSVDFPLAIHEDAGYSYISIFTDGFGTEFPSGKNRSFEKKHEKPVAFDINRNESLAFFLVNDQEWGYFIVPSSPPASWSQHGFIFAQAAVNDFTIKCFDKETGKELEMSECDPLLGDSVIRYGEVVQEDLQTIKSILQSIKFKDNTNKKKPDLKSDTNGIIITNPQPGSEISSPLEITGKARGSWFFEAVIEIELQKNGKTLASTAGKAQGNWMINDYVDFSAILKFPEVKETGKAELYFRSSNPSGKKVLEKSLMIPVLISK